MPLTAGQACPACTQAGRQGQLQQQQINFEEALLLCDNEQCVFPMGYLEFEDYRIEKQAINSVPEPRQDESAVWDILSHGDPLAALNDVLTSKKTEVREIELVKKSVFLQWRNNHALCWLDVLLTLLVHCTWLRRLVDQATASVPDTVTVLIATYDRALAMMTKQHVAKSLKTVVPSGGGTAIEEHVPNQSNGNPILRRFFDSLDVYGLSGKEKKAQKPEKKSRYTVLNYDSHEIEKFAAKTPAKKTVTVVDKPEALVKLRRHLRDAASHYKNVDIRVYNDAEQLLNCAREEVWDKLHPLMQCEKGKNDSPLIALFVLLHTWTGESNDIGSLFNIGGCWQMICSKCQKTSKMTIKDKAIVTFPSVRSDFNVNNAYFVRTCPTCSAPNQQYTLRIDRLPNVLMFHFMNGLPTSDMDRYEFERDGATYRVRALVRYRNKPTDHFIAYVRDPDQKLWMECDDLKSPLCSFSVRKLQIPASEIHLVMWEKMVTGTNKSLQSPARTMPVSTSLKSLDLDDIVPSVPPNRSAAVPGNFTESANQREKISANKPQQSTVDIAAMDTDLSALPDDEFLKMLTSSVDDVKSQTSSRTEPSAADFQPPLPVSQPESIRSSSSSRPSSPHIRTRPSTPASHIETTASERSRPLTLDGATSLQSQKCSHRAIRSSIFSSTTTSYVWDKLTDGGNKKELKGTNATLKAIAKVDANPKSKLKNRMTAYLSGLKSVKTGNEFDGYSSKSASKAEPDPPVSRPGTPNSAVSYVRTTSTAVKASCARRSTNSPTTNRTAQVSAEKATSDDSESDDLCDSVPPFSSGGRALSEDSLSIFSFPSARSFPSTTGSVTSTVSSKASTTSQVTKRKYSTKKSENPSSKKSEPVKKRKVTHAETGTTPTPSTSENVNQISAAILDPNESTPKVFVSTDHVYHSELTLELGRENISFSDNACSDNNQTASEGAAQLDDSNIALDCEEVTVEWRSDVKSTKGKYRERMLSKGIRAFETPVRENVNAKKTAAKKPGKTKTSELSDSKSSKKQADSIEKDRQMSDELSAAISETTKTLKEGESLVINSDGELMILRKVDLKTKLKLKPDENATKPKQNISDSPARVNELPLTGAHLHSTTMENSPSVPRNLAPPVSRNLAAPLSRNLAPPVPRNLAPPLSSNLAPPLSSNYAPPALELSATPRFSPVTLQNVEIPQIAQDRIVLVLPESAPNPGWQGVQNPVLGVHNPGLGSHNPGLGPFTSAPPVTVGSNHPSSINHAQQIEVINAAIQSLQQPQPVLQPVIQPFVLQPSQEQNGVRVSTETELQNRSIGFDTQSRTMNAATTGQEIREMNPSVSVSEQYKPVFATQCAVAPPTSVTSTMSFAKI